jgi:hypothetical protein
MARTPKPPDREASPRHKSKQANPSKSQVMKGLRALLIRPGTQLEAGEYHERVSLGYGSKGVGAGRHRNDRGAALLLAANLENSLQIAIERRLAIAETHRTILFVDEASPLRRFSAKIRMGYALGLFGDGLKSNLDLVRIIRNVFAHAASPVHFSTPEVMGACVSHDARLRGCKQSKSGRLKDSRTRALYVGMRTYVGTSPICATHNRQLGFAVAIGNFPALKLF